MAQCCFLHNMAQICIILLFIEHQLTDWWLIVRASDSSIGLLYSDAGSEIAKKFRKKFSSLQKKSWEKFGHEFPVCLHIPYIFTSRPQLKIGINLFI